MPFDKLVKDGYTKKQAAVIMSKEKDKKSPKKKRGFASLG